MAIGDEFSREITGDEMDQAIADERAQMTADALYAAVDWTSDDYALVSQHAEQTANELLGLIDLPTFDKEQRQIISDAIRHLYAYRDDLDAQGESA